MRARATAAGDYGLAEQFTSSIQTLKGIAENEARKKQIYIERIAVPDLTDYPLEPRRLRGIAATLALSLLAWGVATTLLAGIREHRD